MLGQRPVDGDGKPRHRVELFEAARHQMSAPPPKLKKLRKNELAAKAIERPNTIWIKRRKPPDVSTKASARTMAIITITHMRSEERRIGKTCVGTYSCRCAPCP